MTRPSQFLNRTNPWEGFHSLALFIRELIINPLTVGAIIPSSRKLAYRMASFIPDHLDGTILELGAGTGAVTSAILDRGIHPKRIITIERSPDLVRLLKRRFPELTIIHGDARFLKEILNDHFGEKNRDIHIIISSLPLRSLPKSTVRAIENQLDQILSRNGRFIQFTYDIRSNIPSPFQQFTRCESRIVWRNLPPARVDVFQHKSAA